MRRGVLIPCGGRWVGAVFAVRQAMSELPAFEGGRVVVADRDPATPAGFFADATVQVPSIADEGYVEALLDACARFEVRVVLPLIDLDLMRLAPHLDTFRAAGTEVVCPPPEVVDLCMDKGAFHAFCAGAGLPVPRRHGADSAVNAPFPLFARRIRGFGSIGARVVQDLDALQALGDLEDWIVEELVEGDELSVDCYLNRDGVLTVRVPRQRDKVVGGEAQRSHTLDAPETRALADRTARALAAAGLRGPFNLQLFRGGGGSLIEVNTRVGSCTVLSNQATDGRLYRSILTEAAGGLAEGDPDDYRRDLAIYRFTGDVYLDGGRVLGAVPPRAGDLP